MWEFSKYGDHEIIAVVLPNSQQLIDDLDRIVKSLTDKSIEQPLYVRLKIDSYLISNRVISLGLKGNIEVEYDFDPEEDGAKIKILFKFYIPSGWPLSFYYLIY